ncbi:MAG: thiamine phosphate synthase [bacterium]
MRGFYFITDSRLSLAGDISDVRSALAAGVRVIQYRDKYLTTKKMYEEALRLRKLCRGATFLINDRLDLALAVGADGVHLGSYDLPYRIARRLLGKKRIIGLTVHNLEEARQAQIMGADYLGVSPVFATATKSDAGEPVGTGLIRRIKKAVSLPVVAIGGINLKNAKEVILSGADSLCAIAAVVRKADVKREISRYQELFERYSAV